MKKPIGYLLLTFLLSQTCIAQTDWSAATSLRPGTGLALETKDGKKFDASLIAFSPAALSLKRGGKPTEIQRDSILRLYTYKGSVRRSTLWGTLVGAGAGAISGAWACRQGCVMSTRSQSGAGALGGAMIGAGFGTGIGFVVGVVRHKHKLVYEAR